MKMKLKTNGKKCLIAGGCLLLVFTLWTLLIQCIDVRVAGPKETSVGFACLNLWIHRLTGVHMGLYTLTDWLGLVPVFVCMFFCMLGFLQLIKRRSLFMVDADLIMLGGYYIIVIIGYLVFEMIPVNFRPVLINGLLEASYPSSTTLLVLCVMPTLAFQAERRLKKQFSRGLVRLFVIFFSVFMVIGRLVAGVHWLTDIVGAVFLSAGLYLLYRGAVEISDGKKGTDYGEEYNGVS